MKLSKLNPLSSSGSDDEEDPLENIETTGGSRQNAESSQSEPKKKRELTGELADEERDVPDIGDYHRDLIAPTSIRRQTDMAQVGSDYTRTYFINGWPDDPINGFLDEVLLQNEVQCDVSIHIRPFDSETAVKRLRSDARKARAYVEDSTGGFLTGQSKIEDFQETVAIFDALRGDDIELFDVGMYLTVRGETEKEVIQASGEIVTRLRSSPALTHPEIARYNQTTALQSVSPVMHDQLEYRTEMMGGAIAAMFPFGTKTIYEPKGIDFGQHAGNGSPVIVNRYEARDTGYNQLTIGDIGSGKSFSTKLNLLRTYAARNDVKIFIIDPLQGFESINEVLGGTAITVGGSQSLNPMEISQTPDEVVQRQPDIDPFGTQLKKVMDFFEMFFAKQGLKLGKSRTILQQAVVEAYKKRGITQDIDTHGRPSPTVRDVVHIIENMVENTDKFTELKEPLHEERIKDLASRLALALQQFKEGGQYDNLGGEGDIDFSDNDVFYLDLSQQEGSGTFGIVMHLLLSEVYEHAKQTDDKVLLALDEAHYLMNDAQSLSYLTHVVRHSRHHNLSINFITQEIEDFFDHDEAETIANNTSLKLFHKISSGIPEDIANILDLTPQERSHIKQARAGKSERGFSEALIGVEDKGYYPIQVIPSELEMELLSYEPKNEPARDLLDVANAIDGVEIPNRPNIEAVKEELMRDTSGPAEFGSEERLQQIKEQYGVDLSDDIDTDEELEDDSVNPEEIENANQDEEIDEETVEETVPDEEDLASLDDADETDIENLFEDEDYEDDKSE